MDLEQLVGEAREREPEPLEPHERLITGLSAAGLLLATVGVAAVLPTDRHADPLMVGLLTVLLAIACRVEFEIGRVHAVPAQLVIVPMFFLTPLSIVPLLVAVGYLLGELPEFVKRQTHTDRWLWCVSDAWATIGPVLVLGLLAEQQPNIGDIPVYALAVVAQGAGTMVHQSIIQWLIRREPLRATAVQVLYTERIDAMLTPLAYLV